MARIPTADEIAVGETVVHVDAAAKPDSAGRVMFTAFWRTDQDWVPGGVRGQVFHMPLDEFLARDNNVTVHRI